MKKLLFISITFLGLVMMASCLNQIDEPKESDSSKAIVVNSIDYDPLIISLQSLNDSLIAQSQIRFKASNIHSRGFWDKFKKWWKKACTVVCADLKGAYEGGKEHLKNNGLTGLLDAAITTGIAASETANNEYEKTNNIIEDAGQDYSIISIDSILLAYSNVNADLNLYNQELTRNKQINILIPEDYIKCAQVGVFHNASLRLLLTKAPLEKKLEDGLTSEQLTLLQSKTFRDSYDQIISGIKSFNLDYYIENPKKTEKVIQLFIQAIKEYPNELEDINVLVNNYISLIEKDRGITPQEKTVVYAALSTASYSAYFWAEMMNE